MDVQTEGRNAPLSFWHSVSYAHAIIVNAFFLVVFLTVWKTLPWFAVIILGLSVPISILAILSTVIMMAFPGSFRRV
jgi:hypothetical protein